MIPHGGIGRTDGDREGPLGANRGQEGEVKEEEMRGVCQLHCVVEEKIQEAAVLFF